jgi:hypothetical protein
MRAAVDSFRESLWHNLRTTRASLTCSTWIHSHSPLPSFLLTREILQGVPERADHLSRGPLTPRGTEEERLSWAKPPATTYTYNPGATLI